MNRCGKCGELGMARPLRALRVRLLAEDMPLAALLPAWRLTAALSPAGATADAFTLFERLEMQLEAHPGLHRPGCVHVRHALACFCFHNPTVPACARRSAHASGRGAGKALANRQVPQAPGRALPLLRLALSSQQQICFAKGQGTPRYSVMDLGAVWVC